MRRDRPLPRRSISHILTPLAAGLVLFVLYQAWIKPSYVSDAPRRLVNPEGPSPSTFSDAWSPPGDAVGSTNAPRNRYVEPGEPPSRSLAVVREQLAKGRLREAEKLLRGLSDSRQRTADSRYLAALWNNLGIQQEHFGGTPLSIAAFQEAAKRDRTNPTILLNLTQAYWELRHPAMTPKFLEDVIRLMPDDPFPHSALAELLLDRRDPAAAAHLREARRLANADAGILSYVQRLSGRFEALARSHPATSRPSPPAPSVRAVRQEPVPPTAPAPAPEVPPDASSAAAGSTSAEGRRQLTAPAAFARFVVQYDGEPDPAVWSKVKAILEYAFDDISRQFGHMPAKPTVVVLHMNRAFDGVTGSPLWADALVGRRLGTMHVPAQGALEDLAVFSRVVRHQFAHVLLAEYLKDKVVAAPTWLQEGLALQLADDPWPDLEEAQDQGPSLIPLTALQGDWTSLNPSSALIAYREARSASKSLIDRYSVYSVRQVLNLLRTGQSFDSAMLHQLSISYGQFQQQWEQAYRMRANEG